jgi:hypothetical protein
VPKYLLSANRRGGRIAQRLLAKTWQFAALFSEALRFCLHSLEVERAGENFKNAQRFFSYFCSLQPDWCDSPFKSLFMLICLFQQTTFIACFPRFQRKTFRE